MANDDRIWRCSCKGSHFLSIQYLDWGKDSLGELCLESAYRPERFWERVKVAWQVLTRGVCTLDCVLIEDGKVAREIADTVMAIGKRLNESGSV